MKIIQINSSSSSFIIKDYERDIYRGWYAQVACELKKAYPKLEIECWTPEKKYKKEKSKTFQGVKFRIFPTNLSVRNGMEFSLPMVKALKKEEKIARQKGEKLILQFHEYHSWQTYLMLLRKDKRTKVIAQHHGGRSPFKNLMKYKRLLLFLPAIVGMQFCENLLFKKVDIFYSLSNEEISYIKKLAPKSKVKFQTVGISNDYFKMENKNKLRKKLGLEKDKKYIMYLGRIKTTKGIRELLDIIGDIDAELLLIGGGRDDDKYKAYAKEIGVKNANFLGAIYGNAKLDYLAACDCLVLPSYTEGTPVVIMEALARNLPIVATTVGGIPRMMENGVQGILIPPQTRKELRNALKKVLGWKKKNLRKYAERYRWNKIIKETMKDYKKLIEK